MNTEKVQIAHWLLRLMQNYLIERREIKDIERIILS